MNPHEHLLKYVASLDNPIPINQNHLLVVKSDLLHGIISS